MQNKLLENGSKYEKYDTNNDGVVSDEEMKEGYIFRYFSPENLELLKKMTNIYHNGGRGFCGGILFVKRNLFVIFVKLFPLIIF